MPIDLPDQVEYTVLFVQKAVAEIYQARSFPTLYLIYDGQVVFSIIGYSRKKITELKNRTAALLKP